MNAANGKAFTVNSRIKALRPAAAIPSPADVPPFQIEIDAAICSTPTIRGTNPRC